MISALRILILSMGILSAVPVFAAEPPPAAKPKLQHEAGRKFRRRPPKAFFAKLTETERAEIDRLAREGKKEELRKVMRELMFKYRPEEMKQLDALSERYLKSADEKERAAIRQEMEKLSRLLFRKRQDFTRNNIADAEKQLQRAQQDLERLKKHYQRNEQNAEKIIADHVEQMCLPPEQRKRFGGKFPRKPEKAPSPSPAPADAKP